MPDVDITPRQQRFLFARGSAAERDKLAGELRRGDVKVRRKIRKGHGIGGSRRRSRRRRR